MFFDEMWYNLKGDNMLDVTFLEEEQIFDGKLKIFENIGTTAAITDFSILLGGFVNNSLAINNSGNLGDRTGYWWTKTDDKDNDARIVTFSGAKIQASVNFRIVGSRPAFQIPFSSISSIASNGVRGNDDIYEFEYGEYPQESVDYDLQVRLESLYNINSLNPTGRKYTIDSRKYDQYDLGFEGKELQEYELGGRRFVRVIANSSYDGNEFTLSNGRKYRDGDAVWVEVKPITWLYDKKTNIALSKNILFAGVQFNKVRNYKGDFNNTDIKRFIDNCFSKEIVQSVIYSNTFNQNNEKDVKRNNPYNLSFENVSEEDIIKACILSGITPYLHGMSSEGKSARVKQLDKDCEIIYLATATPESLLGKSVYVQPVYKRTEVPVKRIVKNSETNEDEEITVYEYRDVMVEPGHMLDIKPSWLIKLEEKCAKEPDKIHILFLDELANALPAIQKMAFNLILDREVDGKWKLPENARIVAAGNEVLESSAANELAEPLFNRLAHVYIKTTVDSWLKWAITPDEEYKKLDLEESKVELKIHPAIYAFINYKRDLVLRTEFNGKTPNADPRKWEMASKVLYQTKNPEMLRALIGIELTIEFVAFCKNSVITIEDVINGNYKEQDLEMNVGQKSATVAALSYVDEKNLVTVRNFVSKLGDESLALFESLWTKGDLSRLERIAELRMEGGIKK